LAIPVDPAEDERSQTVDADVEMHTALTHKSEAGDDNNQIKGINDTQVNAEPQPLPVAQFEPGPSLGTGTEPATVTGSETATRAGGMDAVGSPAAPISPAIPTLSVIPDSEPALDRPLAHDAGSIIASEAPPLASDFTGKRDDMDLDMDEDDDEDIDEKPAKKLSLDLLDRIKGMYRLLDLINEQGSGGAGELLFPALFPFHKIKIVFDYSREDYHC
jgi:hypothetical protein